MTKGQKTALGVVAIGGIAVAGYLLYQQNKKSKMPSAMPVGPIYGTGMGVGPGYQAQPQGRPVLDFFTGLIGSGKVSRGISNIREAFGKGQGSGGSVPYGPITEAQYNAQQSAYTGPFRN
tara:strand:+ start:5431 stop:5790 length:360 start_codon:yes stop_codon:yes gene_type:complete